jgi:RNA polymerase sigma-70 factor (ECF subfamily)
MGNMNTEVKNTDQDIYQKMVREHSARMFNLALMKCNQVSLAEDICQETFLRAYKGIKSFRQESKIGTWIYRIALNVCHTMISEESQRTMNIVQFEDVGETNTFSQESDIQDIVMRKSNKQRIRRAISALPRNQSDAITLYYLKEFQYNEVAEIMGIPINTVKSHIRRAKESLRKLLQEVEQ